MGVRTGKPNGRPLGRKDINPHESYKVLIVPDNVSSINDLQLFDRQLAFIKIYADCNFVLHKAKKKAHIGSEMFYDWKENYPHFAKAIEICRERFVDAIESKFAELVEEKNPQIVMFGLKTLGRNRGYAEKQEINHTGLEGIKVTFDEDEPKIIDAEVIEE